MTQHHIPQDLNPLQRHRENLTSHAALYYQQWYTNAFPPNQSTSTICRQMRWPPQEGTHRTIGHVAWMGHTV